MKTGKGVSNLIVKSILSYYFTGNYNITQLFHRFTGDTLSITVLL